MLSCVLAVLVGVVVVVFVGNAVGVVSGVGNVVVASWCSSLLRVLSNPAV